jgi:hypothetical protein
MEMSRIPRFPKQFATRLIGKVNPAGPQLSRGPLLLRNEVILFR